MIHARLKLIDFILYGGGEWEPNIVGLLLHMYVSEIALNGEMGIFVANRINTAEEYGTSLILVTRTYKRSLSDQFNVVHSCNLFRFSDRN